MNSIKKITDKMVKAFKEEYGQDATMDDGEVIAGVFNDCIVTMEMVGKELKINICAGEPYVFNENAFEESEK